MTFNSDRIFRIITVFVILYLLVAIGSNIVFAISSFLQPKSPLIPEKLIYYSLFPLIFLIPFFAFCVWYCWKSLFKETLNKVIITLIFAICLFYFFCPNIVFDGLYSINPYRV
ncbi:hypothetical protein DZC78_05655 [Olleya aquimaris]|nr:hypothetical protein DZC78_05655 [Olleya aquimaris]